MASFGGSAVVTGGVGASVFLVYTINFGVHKTEFDSSCPGKSSTSPSSLHSNSQLVNGVQTYFPYLTPILILLRIRSIEKIMIEYRCEN